MSLEEYKKKRDFKKTKEPSGVKKSSEEPIFVIQKHDASSLHYDFRIEIDGVLKSWAVPKGPSLNPKVKRLAINTEDHPIDYANFEGTIPEGEYGAGTVIVWDNGTFKNTSENEEKDISLKEAYQKGHISIFLQGKKLRGGYALIQMKGKGNKWLLVKKSDDFADRGKDVLKENPKSALSDRTLKELENSEKQE